MAPCSPRTRLYADKAARIAALARDPSEVLAVELARPEVALPQPGAGRKIAFHSPCSLQHGQKLPGLAEGLLTRLGYELTPVADGHLCCGSAGSYSLLQPTLARQLRDNKARQPGRRRP
jgi:glycolate oxidase iron-sulfur subunit